MQLQLASLPALPKATSGGLRSSICNHASASIQQHQQQRPQWRSLWERAPNLARAMTLQAPRGAPPQLPTASLQSLLEASKAMTSPAAWAGTAQAQRQSGRAAVLCGGLPALPQGCRPPFRGHAARAYCGVFVDAVSMTLHLNGCLSCTVVLTSRTLVTAIVGKQPAKGNGSRHWIGE